MSENFHFTAMKVSVYLNRRVFVMYSIDMNGFVSAELGNRNLNAYASTTIPQSTSTGK